MKTITVATLNITLPAPHKPQRYAELWLDAARSISAVKLRGDTGGLIGSAHTYKQGEISKYIYGDLYKFVNIDFAGKWLDLSTGQAAPPDAVDRQVRIPENLRPNLRFLPYVLFPKFHRIVFISYADQSNAISPGMAKSLVERCLTRSELIDKYGKVEVTVEPDRETLGRIFALPKLTQFRIEVSPPNALADIERKLFKMMDEQNADKFVQQLDSHDPRGLLLSNEIKQIAEVAQSNGAVFASGVNEQNRLVHVSTTDHPLLEKVTYNPKTTTPAESLIQKAQEIVQGLVARDQGNAEE
jgi:Domain of unknown function (DUF4747)